MKKKIFITSVAVAMILSITCMILVGCNKDFKESTAEDFTPPEMAIGKEMPNWDNIKPINKKMSAFEMLQVGMENFYNANYAVIEYTGKIDMKVLGFPISQTVQSTKIRQGLGDPNGDNARGATYFADNKSAGAANLYEKFIIRPNEFIRKGAPGKKVSYNSKKGGRLGQWTVKEWNAPNTYQNLDELVTENSNNPTILWMYDLQKDLIIDKLDPIYDQDSKTYRFSLKFDPLESTKKYIEVMKVQLQNNAGMEVEGLEFKQLILEVVMWENGTIRSINVNEAYQMKMMLDLGATTVPLDNKVNLKATQLFSYDENEADYKIADHLANF